jgi:hypothetical protein
MKRASGIHGLGESAEARRVAYLREEYAFRVNPAKRTEGSVRRFYTWLKNTGRLHLISNEPSDQRVKHLMAHLKGLVGRTGERDER